MFDTGTDLVTSSRFFLMLSTPGFSLSGSPFLPVAFLLFLFTAWLMVLAQCLGSSWKRWRAKGKKEIKLTNPAATLVETTSDLTLDKNINIFPQHQTKCVFLLGRWACTAQCRCRWSGFWPVWPSHPGTCCTVTGFDPRCGDAVEKTQTAKLASSSSCLICWIHQILHFSS